MIPQVMQKLFTLRTLRRFIALIFLLLFGFAFVDFSGTLSSDFIQGLLYLQFTPSVIKFITVGGIAASGFVIVTLLTFLFGRVYCSMLCPLGIIQDIAARVRFKKPKYVYLKPWNLIRYISLFIIVSLALLGSLFLLYTFDPYSLAGRIFSDLIRPIYYGVNNLLVVILGFFNSYALHHVDFKGMPWQGVAITGSFAALLLFVAWRWGRIYCNSICPVGSFLSIISRYSLFRIVIDEKTCTACNRCVRTCKASCIDMEQKTIDFSRCVACYNCIDSCNAKGISYRFALKPIKNSKAKDVDTARRSSLAILSGFAIGALSLGRINMLFAQNSGQGRGKGNRKAGAVFNERNAPITPPGSYNQMDFLNACTACHLCVSVCPTHVLQPSISEFGFWGMLQPHMDFHSGFCNFECTKCGEVCPTGAIRLLELETKKRVQIGKAKFHRANCIVRVDRTECGACSEHCPTKAVKMVPWQGLFIPEVDEDICIGCGACEYACPTEPYKAIYVNGNTDHLVAELPEQIDDAPRESNIDDFPF